MKILYFWEDTDIEAGRHIWSHSGQEMIIGYIVRARGPKRWCLIDPRDGAVMNPETKAGLAKSLSQHTYQPHKPVGS